MTDGIQKWTGGMEAGMMVHANRMDRSGPMTCKVVLSVSSESADHYDAEHISGLVNTPQVRYRTVVDPGHL